MEDFNLAGPQVLKEDVGHVRVLTIDRPDARNAIDSAVAKVMDSCLTEAEADEAIRVVVITGSCDKVFCAGADMKHLALHGPDGLFMGDRGLAGITTRRFAKPLVAAVNGAALGGGFEIVLACDLVVAAEHATFGLPEVKLGAMAAGGLPLLARRVARNVALEIALTGGPIDAARAKELGLVNRVVPLSELRKSALALATIIADNAPLAVRSSKTLIEDTVSLSVEEALALSSELRLALETSEDWAEGMKAALEKRKPEWSGR